MHYRLALTAEDQTRCKTLCREHDLHVMTLEYPTVMVLTEDEELVGILGTTTDRDIVQAEPILLSDTRGKNRGVVIKRMIEHYEEALRAAGCSSYWFCIASDHPWRDLVDQIVSCQQEHDGLCWYKRGIA